MYDRVEATRQGLIVHCEATLLDPVTMSGTYRCTEGHAHSVQGMQGHPAVSQTGYDWAFLGALNAADEAALIADNPDSPAYCATYAAVLRDRGYASVALPVVICYAEE